ncbi:hypothetical protein [Actinomadura rubrisoli]|uniref:Uncharacterized protein n=1 Tax=Actinomadura rubrisoli TaxID=2530368 RepID=A0A4R5CCG7_9ACTN|nr:hypothetical protein [Actinomadura rubrisoli]TDD97688.1 hypothetical protein E1298_01235 [Actinomadura rubrisoli]
MSNGTITFGRRTYEAGEAAVFMGLRRYGLEGTHELRGDTGAPKLVCECTTSKPGHRFKLTALFQYTVEDTAGDGTPYGFHFAGGIVKLADPPPGMNAERRVSYIRELTNAVDSGEAEFIQGELFAIRALAAVDQAAANLRDRGEPR